MRSLKVFCIYIPLGAYICICEFSHLYWRFENILQFCLEVFYGELSSISKRTEFSYVQTVNVQEKFVRWILLPCFYMHYLAGAFIWLSCPRKSSHLNFITSFTVFMYLYGLGYTMQKLNLYERYTFSTHGNHVSKNERTR